MTNSEKHSSPTCRAVGWRAAGMSGMEPWDAGFSARRWPMQRYVFLFCPVGAAVSLFRRRVSRAGRCSVGARLLVRWGSQWPFGAEPAGRPWRKRAGVSAFLPAARGLRV